MTCHDDAARELLALHEKATPGPWYAHNTEDAVFMNAYAVTTSLCEPDCDGDTDFAKDGHDKSIVALTLLQCPRVVGHESTRWAEDAELIAQSRTHIAALCRGFLDRGEEVGRLKQAVLTILAARIAVLRIERDAIYPGSRRTRRAADRTVEVVEALRAEIAEALQPKETK